MYVGVRALVSAKRTQFAGINKSETIYTPSIYTHHISVLFITSIIILLVLCVEFD